MALAARRRDGLLRLDAADLPGGALLVTVGSGRVELGRAAGQQVRVRWTLPGRLRPAGGTGPKVRPSASGLRIEARRARLRIDVPDVVNVTVRLGRGEITSWGAGSGLMLNCTRGRVVCRELACRTVSASGRYVNLHFAAAPEAVEVDARESVLALPPGPYAVTAPPGAEIEVAVAPAADRRITVSGGPSRLLTAKAPLSLRDEGSEGSEGRPGGG